MVYLICELVYILILLDKHLHLDFRDERLILLLVLEILLVNVFQLVVLLLEYFFRDKALFDLAAKDTESVVFLYVA